MCSLRPWVSAAHHDDHKLPQADSHVQVLDPPTEHPGHILRGELGAAAVGGGGAGGGGGRHGVAGALAEDDVAHLPREGLEVRGGLHHPFQLVESREQQARAVDTNLR